jgi:DNA sulfur modification protein DndD
VNRIESIELHNFGPFKGVQRLDLPHGDGVVVVYGQNGKGKTSLLNAVRWALTGTVLDRAGRARPPEALVNREALAENDAVDCKVVVSLDIDGTPYELTRWVDRTGERVSVDMLLRQDTTVLNRVDAEAELERLFPHDTQQFFLFDGELLNQFESLTRDDHSAGEVLKQAMERMLGVPIVANAARDCEAVSDEATDRLAEKAKQDKDSAQVGNQLAQAQTLLAEAKVAARKEQERIDELETQRREVDAELSAHELSQQTMGQITLLRDKITADEDTLAVDRQNYQTALAEAWRAVLSTSLRSRFDAAAAQVDDLRAQRDRAAFASELRDARGDNKKLCPACGTDPLPKKNRQQLDEILEGAGDLDTLDADLAHSRSQMDLLGAFVDDSAATALRTSEAAVRKGRADLNDLRDQVRALEEQLGDIDEKTLRDLVRRSEQITLAITGAGEALAAADGEGAAQRTLVEGFTKKLDGFSQKNVDPATRHQLELGQRLHELFTRGIDEYRSRLLRNVEAAATRLFLRMRSEEGFTGLRINERYGLSILDDAGHVVPDRSAGYEHLVALSLIGGLQACSTISGPVLMDSPFGRLDGTHVKQVTSSVSMLSPQVVLLVHEGEIHPNQAGALLEGKLLAEFTLVRRSATHTDIERRKAS